jgi:hypothetical protein
LTDNSARAIIFLEEDFFIQEENMTESEYVNISLTFDKETLRRLRELATATDRSLSAMARWCVNNEYERITQASQPPASSPEDKTE